MARIQFKSKPVTVYNPDDSIAWIQVNFPKLTRSHCDMNAFRRHPKYGSFANSDLFPNILAKIRRNIIGEYADSIRLDKLPDNVTIDTSGFLAIVTIDV